MARLKKVMNLALSAICLILLPADLSAQQQDASNIKTDNAAVYYQKAVDLMKYPESKHTIWQAIKNGWAGEDEELEAILAQNEPCFREFKKGLSLKKCDFNFGREYTYLMQKTIAPFMDLRSLCHLVLLKGRYYEKEGAFDKAIDEYLSLLTLAGHVSQDKVFLSQALSILAVGKTSIRLESYLKSKEANKKQCLRILNSLENCEKQCFPSGELKKLIEGEKEGLISTMQMYLDDPKLLFEENHSEGFGDLIKGREEAYKDIFMKQARDLADRYYANYIKAAETNKERDWKFAEKEVDRLVKRTSSLSRNIIFAIRMVLKGALGRRETGVEMAAKKMATALVSIGIPNFKYQADSYNSALKELRELQALARTKAK